MKLENQVILPEISKELKNLGVKQESLFYWVDAERENDFNIYYRYDEIGSYPNMIHCHKHCRSISAFTVAELGEMLPFCPPTWKSKGIWLCCYPLHDKKCIGEINQRADTEANARGKMLIYLIKNKLIEGNFNVVR